MQSAGSGIAAATAMDPALLVGGQRINLRTSLITRFFSLRSATISSNLRFSSSSSRRRLMYEASSYAYTDLGEGYTEA
jgi:hypothetical protein